MQRTFGDSVPHRHNFPNLISFSLSASHSIADGALHLGDLPNTWINEKKYLLYLPEVQCT